MANTGAPWNIPYVEPTDIPRTYPEDSEDLALAVAAGLTDLDTAIDNIPVLAGIGSNVVQTVKTDTFSTSSTSFTAITGMSVTITPTSDTSKILVLVTAKMSTTTNGVFRPTMRLMRGATPIFIGDADGSRTRASAYSGNASNQDVFSGDMVFLDSPATDIATTYSLEAKTESGSSFVLNRSGVDSNNAIFGRTASSITVIEVAA